MRLPKYVHGFIDRHGRPRFYFRRAGFRRVPLLGLPWSPEFMAVYEEALNGTRPVEIAVSRTSPGTSADAVARYLGSTAFTNLAPTTRTLRRAILERFRVEHGDKLLHKLQVEHVARLLGRLRPFAQRNMLKRCVG